MKVGRFMVMRLEIFFPANEDEYVKVTLKSSGGEAAEFRCAPTEAPAIASFIDLEWS